MRLSSPVEAPIMHGPNSAYDWTTDPEYLPSLKEAKTAEETFEGREALYNYYVRPYETERFELWTQEFITGVARHIVSGIDESQTRKPTILEVGAGDGRLSGFLRQTVEIDNIEASVVAVDIAPQRGAAFPVVDIDVVDALHKYKPAVVISSWMPLGHEWTRDMRATPTVKEYILMGVPPMTGSYSTWRGYASPEIGEFTPVDLPHLDKQKTGQFSSSLIPGLKTITRSFRRQTEAIQPTPTTKR